MMDIAEYKIHDMSLNNYQVTIKEEMFDCT